MPFLEIDAYCLEFIGLSEIFKFKPLEAGVILVACAIMRNYEHDVLSLQSCWLLDSHLKWINAIPYPYSTKFLELIFFKFE